MGRADLVREILRVDCDFPVDFTEEHLRSLSLEKLRHVYLALILHGKAPKPAGRKRKGQSAGTRPR